MRMTEEQEYLSWCMTVLKNLRTLLLSSYGALKSDLRAS